MGRYWMPEPCWLGKDVLIIGGGPSLRSFDWDRLKGKHTIGCNDAYLLGVDHCRICHFSDLAWYRKHKERLAEYGGLTTTSHPDLLGEEGLRVLKRYRRGVHVDGIGLNGNTGAGAINLAVILGASRVFLLGFDMAASEDGEGNWHPNDIDEPSQEVYDKFADQFQFVRRDLYEKYPSCVVVNLNPDSLLEGFIKCTWEDVRWRD